MALQGSSRGICVLAVSRLGIFSRSSDLSQVWLEWRKPIVLIYSSSSTDTSSFDCNHLLRTQAGLANDIIYEHLMCFYNIIFMCPNCVYAVAFYVLSSKYLGVSNLTSPYTRRSGVTVLAEQPFVLQVATAVPPVRR